MKFTQIRNATAIIEFYATRFLVDPLFAPKETYPGLPGTSNDHLHWPRVELPMSINSIVSQIDAVIVTHTHPDHWDEYAANNIPKSKPIFAQNPMDADLIRNAGFTDVRLLSKTSQFCGIQLIKTLGQHGSDKTMEAIGNVLGNVCGVVFRHPEEKTTYLAGDTLWNPHVENAISVHQPEIIILNAGHAMCPLGPITMGKQDTLNAHKALPKATIIATHMEAVSHAMLTRAELHEFIEHNGIKDFVLVPEDGETFML